MLNELKFTLSDGSTQFCVNDSRITALSYSNAVSANDRFDIGGVKIDQLTFDFVNFDGAYNKYNLFGAKVEYYRNNALYCTMVVDKATDSNGLISITAYDYKSYLERPFSECGLIAPITCHTLAYYVCAHCGVEFISSDFPNKNFSIARLPEGDTISCRQILSYVAQMCGCFVKSTPTGQIYFSWYDTTPIGIIDGGTFDWEQLWGGNFLLTEGGVYSTGDDFDGGDFDAWSNPQWNEDEGFDVIDTEVDADGGDFTAWTQGDDIDGGSFEWEYENIYQFTKTDIFKDDITITGLSVKAKGTAEDYGETVTYGTSEYMLSIEDNPLIIEGTAQTILNAIKDRIVGMTFRPFVCAFKSDFDVQAGDRAVISIKGNLYTSYINNVTNSLNQTGEVACEAERPYQVETNRSGEAQTLLKKAVEQAMDATLQEIQATNLTLSGRIKATNIEISGGSISLTSASSTMDLIKLIYGSKMALLQPNYFKLYGDNNLYSTQSDGGFWSGKRVSGSEYQRTFIGTNIAGDGAMYLLNANNEIKIYAAGDTGYFSIDGDFVCRGTKSRVTDTEDYGKRKFYCYEMTEPIFGDLGETSTDENGEALVWLDDIFLESVENCNYQVFLQKYGPGDIWVEDRTDTFFTVKGSPNLTFGYEIKAVQKGFADTRTEEYEEVEI